ncbi:MAG TPA: peptidylprolyl isomerase [Pyrinomonadaceae bacterium]|nr:peptidylprolyl isomerase [Pyrinomonadaceae bacterium]
MNSTTKAWIAAGVGILFSVGLIVWQVRASHATAINLSADDMSLIASDQAPQVRMRLASDEASRKDFVKNIRELLAVAEEARAKGFTNRADVKRQLELMRAFIISQIQAKEQGQGQGQVTQAEIEGFFKEPGQEERLKQFIADARARNPAMAQQEISPEQMTEIRTQLGQVLIGERRGVAAGLDQQRKTQLQLMLQQSRLLASMYEEEVLVKAAKPSQAEIDAYVKAHPEEQVHARHILIATKSAEMPTEQGGLDKPAARAKAEEVLKRVKAGENFENLAKEYSDDGSKQNGGDLGWFGKGRMVPEFENAAFALQPGQTSEIVESQFGFHIIKNEGRRTGDPERASQEVAQEKEKKLIEEIVKRQSGHITIAENFAVQMPPQQQMPQGLPFEPQAPPAATPAPKGKSSPARK